MSKKKNSYDSDFKLRIVLESFQRDTTIENVKIRYGVSTTAINKWRKQFRENAHLAFEAKKKTQKSAEKDSPEYLKKIIGEITVENEILKKALSV
jgi:putative transposase